MQLQMEIAFIFLFFSLRSFLLCEICCSEQWTCSKASLQAGFFHSILTSRFSWQGYVKTLQRAALEESGCPVGHDLMFSRQCLAVKCTLLQFFNVFKRWII